MHAMKLEENSRVENVKMVANFCRGTGLRTLGAPPSRRRVNLFDAIRRSRRDAGAPRGDAFGMTAAANFNFRAHRVWADPPTIPKNLPRATR
jgi:hypothetical protein